METAATQVITTEAIKKDLGTVKEAALALVVTCPQEVEYARDGIREIKRRRGIIDEHCDSGIKQAHQLHKQLVADKKKLTDELDEAEKIIRRKMADYAAEEERKRLEEQRRAQQEAERLRQLAISNANRKLETVMGKASTVQDQIEAVQTILDDPEATEADKTLTTRKLEVLNMQLQGLQDKAEEAQQKAEIAADAIPEVTAAPVEKIAGVSAKKTFVICHIDASLLVQEIAAGRAPANLIKQWDETALKKMAALGMTFKGVTYQEDRSISVRG